MTLSSINSNQCLCPTLRQSRYLICPQLPISKNDHSPNGKLHTHGVSLDAEMQTIFPASMGSCLLDFS